MEADWLLTVVPLRSVRRTTARAKRLRVNARNRYGRAIVLRLTGPFDGPGAYFGPGPGAAVTTSALLPSSAARCCTLVNAVSLSYRAPATFTTVGESIGLSVPRLSAWSFTTPNDVLAIRMYSWPFFLYGSMSSGWLPAPRSAIVTPFTCAPGLRSRIGI